MKYRQMTNTDLKLSRIGMGTWAIGGGHWKYGWGKQDDKDSITALNEGYELGINWIDTAPIYGIGHSEKIVGQFIKQQKGKVYVATKCGLLADKNGHPYGKLNRDSIKEEVERSLSRLCIDTIDIYQIHWPNPSNEIEEGFSALYELKKEGKIRYPALSNFSVEQLGRVSSIGQIYAHQVPYSLLNRKIEKGLIAWCKSKSIDILAYSPMQCGLLCNKANHAWVESLPNDDWRKTSSDYFKEPKLSKVLSWLEKIKLEESFIESKRSIEELAVEWVLSKDESIYTIVGLRKAGQIEKIGTIFEKSCISSDLLKLVEDCELSV